jgi:hypothetical protein
VLEKADITLNLIDCLKKPETFEDAYYHPNFEERMKWREAISKEVVRALRQTSKLKSWFNPNSTRFTEILIQEGNLYLKRLTLH